MTEGGGAIVAVAACVMLVALAPAGALASENRERVNLATFDEVWRLVRETHFDPELEGVDWEAIRDELRPAARQAPDDRALRAVLQEMLSRLGLSHFELIAAGAWAHGTARVQLERAEGLPAGCPPAAHEELVSLVGTSTQDAATPGVELDVIGEQLLVTRVRLQGGAADAGVRPGWRLLSVGDVAIDPLVACLQHLEGAGFRSQLMRSALAALLHGRPASVVSVAFETGDGDTREVALERRLPGGELTRFGNLPPTRARFDLDWRTTPAGARVAVVRFNIWLLPIARAFDQAMDEIRAGADGVIIDLRDNPGGLAAIAQGIAGHFLDERLSLGALITRHDTLELVANPRSVTREGVAVRPYSGPLAILIDSRTASTSEVFAAGLHDLGRARLFGAPSAGAALPAVMDRLPNGDIFLHATMDYLRPAGGRVEGSPIRPDESVPVTRKDLLAGEDRVLSAALEWIESEMAGGAGQAR